MRIRNMRHNSCAQYYIILLRTPTLKYTVHLGGNFFFGVKKLKFCDIHDNTYI